MKNHYKIILLIIIFLCYNIIKYRSGIMKNEKKSEIVSEEIVKEEELVTEETPKESTKNQKR